MPFMASGSATSGLTAYALEKPAYTLAPEAGGYSRPGSLWAARFTRLLGRRGSAAGALQDTPARKAFDMSTSPLQDLVDALKKSAGQIATTAVPEKREELLGKAIDNFADELAVLTDSVVEEAFADGLRGDLGKYFGADRAQMRKGLTHVSQFAMTLRSAESMVKGMASDTWDNPPSSETIEGLDAWLGIGKGLLKRVTDEAVSADDGAEVGKAYGLDGAELKKFADGLSELIARSQANLAKAEGDGVAEMDPLDVIARLATAILMQIDSLQDGTAADGAASPDAAPEPGSAAAAGGAGGGGGGGGGVPPQFRKNFDDAELTKVAVEPELVDASLLLYQVTGDGSPADIAVVYDAMDNGMDPAVMGKFADFATLDMLKAAAIPAGTIGTCMETGHFRAGTAPAGQFIAEVDNVALVQDEPLGKGAGNGDIDALRKMVTDAVGEAVAPLQAKVDTLNAENQRLRKAAAPSKVVLGAATAVVDKGADDNLGKAEGLPTAEELSKMSETERAVRLIKYSQRAPIRAA